MVYYCQPYDCSYTFIPDEQSEIRNVNKNVMKKIRAYIFITLFSAIVSMALPNIPALSADTDQQPVYHLHTIQAGDSLSKIAREYYDDAGKFTVIAEYNHIKDINRLKLGQQIKIPILALEASKKASAVEEVDIGLSGQGAAETLTEKSLNKGLFRSRLDGPTLVFIMIYLLVMLFLLLIKWIGREDVYHADKPAGAVRPLRGHQWKL